MTIKQNNANVVATVNQRMKALSENVSAKTVLDINGQPMKLSDVVAAYQAALDSRATLVKQRATYKKALDARNTAEVTRLAIDQGLKTWVAAKFGPTSQEALEFGFLPNKVGTKTVATKSEAIAKNLATRKARGTMGKRQKADANPRAPVDDFVELRVVA